MRSAADARPDRTQPDAAAAHTLAVADGQRIAYRGSHANPDQPIGPAGRLAVGQPIALAVRVANGQPVGGCLADGVSQP